jgi:phospholipid transport system substrate-binding protein
VVREPEPAAARPGSSPRHRDRIDGRWLRLAAGRRTLRSTGRASAVAATVPRMIDRTTLRRRALLAALPLAPLLARPRAAGAATPAAGPEDFVGALGDRAVALLGRSRQAPPEAEVAALLDEAVDLGLLARLVLGRHWARASEAQRRDYLELFRAYALQGLTSSFRTYAGLRRFAVTGSRPAGEGDVLVGTELHREPGVPPNRVDWRVREVGGGRFAVVDVVVEGVSLLVTNRSEFDSIVGRSGIDGLLREMRGWRDEAASAAGAAAPGRPGGGA